MIKIWIKQKALLLVIFLGISLPAAVGAMGPGVLADKVQSSYEQTQDLKMDFVQDTYVEVLEQNVKKKGQAYFKKPGKFAIQYSGKRGREYISDGKKLWIFKKGDRQVQLYSLVHEQIPAEALSFLGGLGNLKRDFAVETVDPKKEKNLKIKKGDRKWLELTPLKKRSQIQWIVMGFDPQSYLAVEAYIFTESGNVSHYTFSSLVPNTNLSEDLFLFKKKGVKEVKVKGLEH